MAEHDLVQLCHMPLQETLSLKELQDTSADDVVLSTLLNYLRHGWPVKVPDKLLCSLG